MSTKIPSKVAIEIGEAREHLELDADEPATWERDLLRAVAATQRALVHVRAAGLSCPTCRGSGRVSDPNLFGAYLRCPACRP